MRWVPVLAALVACGADVLLLVAAQTGVQEGVRTDAATWMLWASGILGAIAIPLFASGYRQAGALLERWSGTGGFLVGVLGTLTAILGTMIHVFTTIQVARDLGEGMTVPDGMVMASSLTGAMLWLWAAAAAVSIVASIFIVVGATRLGAWSLALGNPALVTVALAAAGLAIEGGRQFLLPMAPNLAHVVFFAFGAEAARRGIGRSPSRLDVALAESDEDIASCYAVMVQLRPHIDESDFGALVAAQANEGYRLAFVRDAGRVIGVAGFRVMQTLSWGRVLYVDDLVTDETWRSHGVGRRLIGWLTDRAKEEGCGELHLDSGVQRHDAHRFYEREGLRHVAHHFRIRVDGEES